MKPRLWKAAFVVLQARKGSFCVLLLFTCMSGAETRLILIWMHHGFVAFDLLGSCKGTPDCLAQLGKHCVL